MLQLVPVLFLDALHFGYYSIVQLLVVLGSSISLSLLNEADARRVAQGYNRSSWRDFSASLFWICFVFSVAAVTVLLFVDALAPSAPLWGLGVGLAIYRGATRYRLTQDNNLTRLVLGDVVSVAVMLFSGCLVVLAMELNWSLDTILFFWLAALVSNVLFTKIPASINPVRLYTWLKTRARYIATLLPDSALQDIGAFWSPALIALVLDVQSLGIYRAVTTVAAPIRLILTPLRPLLTRGTSSRNYGAALYFRILVLGIILGCIMLLILVGSDRASVDLGVISQLLPFAIPAALYVAGNFISYFFSIQGRIILSSSKLIATRIVQALVLGLSPIIFAFLAGLSGAIWALAIGSFGLGTVWYTVIRLHSLRMRERKVSYQS